MFLEDLVDLTMLNLSFNMLEGEIPEGGIFSSLTSESLIGNEMLGFVAHHVLDFLHVLSPTLVV
jgi:hypothetical protein